MKKWTDGSGLYCGVDMRKVVDVPNDTIASRGRRGKANIVEGLSPVEGLMMHDFSKP